MKNVKKLSFKNFPVLLRVLIYLSGNYLLIFLSQFITGFLPVKGEVAFNVCLCILLLLFTRFILKLEGLSWSDIGCVRGKTVDRLHLVAGTVTGICMLIATAVIIKLLAGFQWHVDPAFQWNKIGSLFIAILCSAFVQELSFRGYPFRLMLKKWGEWPAQIIIALLFGLMHLSGNMSPGEILLTMFTTGIGSVLFGIATIRTRRLHLAVGIHFGWNFAQYLLPRSVSQNGGIWMATKGIFSPNLSYIIWIMPYVVIVIIVYFIIRKYFLVTV